MLLGNYRLLLTLSLPLVLNDVFVNSHYLSSNILYKLVRRVYNQFLYSHNESPDFVLIL